MGRDRSLDEFLGGEGDADDDRSESGAGAGAADDGSGAADGSAVADADAGPGPEMDAGGGDETADESLPDADAVDPATPTHRWTPEGAACESCGTVVERRWVDDGAFVCGDCKEW